MNDNNKYIKYYSEELLFNKVKFVFSRVGISVIYGALLLFYALKDQDVPIKAKSVIITALGVISMFITLEIKRKAREKTLE